MPNPAPTAVTPEIITVQVVAVPLQAPRQPWNLVPSAVSVTRVPAGWSAQQFEEMPLPEFQQLLQRGEIQEATQWKPDGRRRYVYRLV